MLFFVSYFPPAYTRISGEKQSVRLPHAPILYQPFHTILPTSSPPLKCFFARINKVQALGL